MARKSRPSGWTGWTFRQPLVAMRAIDTIKSPAANEMSHLIDRLAKISLIGLFLLGLVMAGSYGSLVLVPVTAAVLVGLTLGPVIDALEDRGIAPYVASLAVLLGIAAILWALFQLLLAPADQWLLKLPEIWQKLGEQIHLLQQPLSQLEEITRKITKATENPQAAKPLEVVTTQGNLLNTILLFIPPIVTQIFIFLGALFFFLANRTRLRTAILALCFSRGARVRTARIFRDSQYFLSRYVATITVINAGLGITTWLVMTIIGLPGAPLWGALAFFFNYVPYLGPALVALLLTGAGLVVFDAMPAALVPAAVFIGLNIVESQIATPSFVGHRLTLNPFVVFVTLSFWMWLWGPIGALLAVPILVVCTVTLRNVLPRYQQPVKPLRAKSHHGPLAEKPAVAGKS